MYRLELSRTHRVYSDLSYSHGLNGTDLDSWSELQKTTLLSLLKFLGFRFGGEKKCELQHILKMCRSHISPKCLVFLSLSTGLADIFLYIHDLHHLHEIYKKKMPCWLIFEHGKLIFGGKPDKFDRKTEEKKFGSAEPVKLAFCKSAYGIVILFARTH